MVVEMVSQDVETALRRLIRETGRMQTWVAGQLGVSPYTVGRIVSGARAVTLVEAVKLAEIFGVPVETFLPPATTPGETGK